MTAVLGVAVATALCEGTMAQSASGPAERQPPKVLKAQSDQRADERLPSFEVASVRLSPPNNDDLTFISPSGLSTFTARSVTLEVLLGITFAVSSDQIAGAPDWLHSQEYDVEAKVEDGMKLSHSQMRPLLQQLLDERFHLKFHREIRNQKGAALEIARDRPKLPPADESSGQAQILPDQLRCPNCSLGILAGLLALVIGRPVIDKTGMSGNYDFKLSYAPDKATDSPLPSIYSALQEQLGLKLVRQNVPVEMLVIDHINRVPTEN